MFCPEFGDTTDIESRSMTVSSQGASYEEILELKNGCLCCSIKDHGVMAIQNLVSSRFELKVLSLAIDDEERSFRLCPFRNDVRLLGLTFLVLLNALLAD
jgi:hypothetical protein